MFLNYVQYAMEGHLQPSCVWGNFNAQIYGNTFEPAHLLQSSAVFDLLKGGSINKL